MKFRPGNCTRPALTRRRKHESHSRHRSDRRVRGRSTGPDRLRQLQLQHARFLQFIQCRGQRSGQRPAAPAASSSAPAASGAASSSAPVAAGSGSSSAAAPGGGSESLTIGSANFSESVLLADIYGEALKAKGVNVTYKPKIGSREVYIPAIKDGSIDMIPDYSGDYLPTSTRSRRRPARRTSTRLSRPRSGLT